MSYVDKNTAIKNLSNPKDFDIFKARFLKISANSQEKIFNLFNENNFDDLYNFVNNIFNLSLNIGSDILYNDSKLVLDKIKTNTLSALVLDNYCETIENVTMELNRL
jgi:hypothetical protein